MGKTTLAIVPTLPAASALERFHSEATDEALYTVVTWSVRQEPKVRGTSASADVRRRQLAVERATHRLLEMQRIGANKDKIRSWFVGNHVHQDGTVVVFTPMDPLFVLLHAVYAQGDKYMSIYDYLERNKNTWWLQLSAVVTQDKIERICDVQYTGDDVTLDSLYVRANDTKIMQWLMEKVRRIALVLSKQAADAANNFDAFDTKFVLPTSQPPVQSKPVVATSSTPEGLAAIDSQFFKEAIDVIADYAPLALLAGLHKEFKISSSSVVPTSKGPTATAASSSESLDSIRRFDRRLHQDSSNASNGKNGNTPNKRTTSSSAAGNSNAKKSKLANVDRTGMKSIASFFGKK